jgi:probable F420-dependent oxidoreductase
MRVDAALETTRLMGVPAIAKNLEALGYDGVYTFEGPHEPFMPLLLAAEHTATLQLTTAVAIAFARNPMTLANIAYDLQLASEGRMTLGLGSQIKPHIEKRFSMEWSRPAARMREMVQAIKAIFAAWHEGAPLDFRGEFYQHTLMTPMFNPGPSAWGPPPIVLAGVGPKMTTVAGEVADGFMIHPFSTEKFMRETTLPALTAGLTSSGRSFDGFEISLPAMTAVGTTDGEIEQARDSYRMRLAFYGSTPAYKVVLDAHGWGDAQPELNRLSKSGGWAEMNSLVTDDMLDAFVTCGTPDTIADALQQRYAGIVDRISVNPPAGIAHDLWSAALTKFIR